MNLALTTLATMPSQWALRVCLFLYSQSRITDARHYSRLYVGYEN